MNRNVLLDTGPLVASLNRRDRYHEWVKVQWAQTMPPFLTCEAVLAEASYLLRQFPGGSGMLMDLLDRGMIQVPFKLKHHARSVSKLMDKYKNLPMDLADACLVRMTELDENVSVMTLDGDFKVYRRLGRKVIPVICPLGR